MSVVFNLDVYSFQLYSAGMFDRDNSGSIDFNEFGALWKYVTGKMRQNISHKGNSVYLVSKKSIT